MGSLHIFRLLPRLLLSLATTPRDIFPLSAYNDPSSGCQHDSQGDPVSPDPHLKAMSTALIESHSSLSESCFPAMQGGRGQGTGAGGWPALPS